MSNIPEYSVSELSNLIKRKLENDFSYIQIKGEKMIAGDITMDKLKKLSKFADIVDVSGALETNKVKDIKKIKEFIKQLNKINNEN